MTEGFDMNALLAQVDDGDVTVFYLRRR